MKLRYSPRAVHDVAAIGRYLRERSPAGAQAVESESRQRSVYWRRSQRSAALLPNVRVMPVVRYPYLVFYTVSPDELVVLHIRHGARSPVTPDDL